LIGCALLSSERILLVSACASAGVRYLLAAAHLHCDAYRKAYSLRCHAEHGTNMGWYPVRGIEEASVRGRHSVCRVSVNGRQRLRDRSRQQASVAEFQSWCVARYTARERASLPATEGPDAETVVWPFVLLESTKLTLARNGCRVRQCAILDARSKISGPSRAAFDLRDMKKAHPVSRNAPPDCLCVKGMVDVCPNARGHYQQNVT